MKYLLILLIYLLTSPLFSQVLKIKMYDYDYSFQIFGDITINDSIHVRGNPFQKSLIFGDVKIGNSYKISSYVENYFVSDSLIQVSNSDTINLFFYLKSFNYPKYRHRVYNSDNIVKNDPLLISYYYMKENLYSELLNKRTELSNVNLKDYTPRKQILNYLGTDHNFNRYYRTVDLSGLGSLHSLVVYKTLRISNGGEIDEMKNPDMLLDEINHSLEFGSNFKRQVTDSLVALYLKLNHFDVVLANDQNYQIFKSFYKDDFYYPTNMVKFNNDYIGVEELFGRYQFRRYTIFGYEDVIPYCLCRYYRKIVITFTRSKININIESKEDVNYKI